MAVGIIAILVEEGNQFILCVSVQSQLPNLIEIRITRLPMNVGKMIEFVLYLLF